MFWKLKAHSLAVLSRIPSGRFLYHRLQQLAGTNRLQLQRDLDRAYELVALIHQSGETIQKKTCYEIGTGWRPLIPYVLILGGAERVVTVDVNPWLTLGYARETWQALGTRLEEIAVHCQVAFEEVQLRYNRLSQFLNDSTLAEMLSAQHIEYIYPGDARQSGLADNSVEIVLSSNVLEHIPQEIQLDIHRESLRILRPGGLAVHRFNPQDHYATVDKSITHGNFLQYSSEDWNWLGGSGLAYHNRLRSRDFHDMFALAGFHMEVCRERLDARTLEALENQSLTPHQEFARYSHKELAVDYMWTACRKPADADTELRDLQSRLPVASSR